MFAERLACELQTYFRSSLLSLRNFGGREATTRNTSAVHRLQKDGTGHSIIRMWYAKNLGWSDCLIVHVKLYESCISTHLPSNSCMFFFSFCLLPSSSIFPPCMLFSYLVAPLPVLSFQEAKMLPLVSLQNFPAIVLNTLEVPLIDFFFVFLCKEFLAISHNFELEAFIFVRAVLSSVHASLP